MIKNTFIGIIICILTSLLSESISVFIGTNILGLERSPVSPIIITIILGALIGNTIPFIQKYNPGFEFSIKYLLKLGIIFLGIRLSISDILLYGLKGLIVIIPSIFLSIIIAINIRQFFKVSNNLSMLIAVGTSICGATAIAALAPSIKAKKEEISYAVANITLFGLIAMFLYPLISYKVFDNNSLSVGLFLGTSIHETAQVAGSGMIYSEQYSNPSVLNIATVIKLVRNTLMVLVIPSLAFYSNKKSKNNSEINIAKIFPYFIFGFIFFGLLRTIGDQYENHIGAEFWINIKYLVKQFSELLLLIAMSAVGYNTKIDKIKNLGLKPFYMGSLAALTVGLVSFSIIYLFIN